MSDVEAMMAAEKLVEHLQEYRRSGLGTANTTVLIDPLLGELQALRQYFYQWPYPARDAQHKETR